MFLKNNITRFIRVSNDTCWKFNLRLSVRNKMRQSYHATILVQAFQDGVTMFLISFVYQNEDSLVYRNASCKLSYYRGKKAKNLTNLQRIVVVAPN